MGFLKTLMLYYFIKHCLFIKLISEVYKLFFNVK